MADEPLGRQSAVTEAHALYRMVVQGTETVTEIRELIQVPARIERALQSYARANPDDAQWVERSLRFRQVVLEEFERLVALSTSVDFPEVTERDSEPFSDALAFAPA
jgi:hypothetical protein